MSSVLCGRHVYDISRRFAIVPKAAVTSNKGKTKPVDSQAPTGATEPGPEPGQVDAQVLLEPKKEEITTPHSTKKDKRRKSEGGTPGKKEKKKKKEG